MDLHSTVGNPADHLSAKVFAAGRFHGEARTAVEPGRGVKHHATRCVGFSTAIREHGLNKLEVDNRLAELLALARESESLMNQTLSGAAGDRGYVQAATVEYLHRCLEALPGLTTNDVLSRDFAAVENAVRCFGPALTHLAVRLPERDTRGISGHDEGGYAAGASLFRLTARHKRKDICVGRVGDVALGSSYDVGIALAFGPRLQMSGGRANIRLGQRKGTDDLTGSQSRQVGLLLCFRAIDNDALRTDANIGADYRAKSW